jgi:hypothetical protein
LFFLLTMPLATAIRRASYGAVCALWLACAAMPLAAARRQDGSAASTTAQKPATTATSTPSHPVHRSTTAKKTSASTTSSGKTAASRSHRSSRRKKTKRARGQQKIDSERATAIQEALIREHYLTGTPSGAWNQASEDAMRRYQSDHGWQTKEVPDSRALIKLGLGPSKDHLLNPESAMTTSPDPPRADPTAKPTHGVAAPADSAPASPSGSSGAAPSTPATTTPSPAPASSTTPASPNRNPGDSNPQ